MTPVKMKLAFKTIQTETAPLPKSTIFWWSLINVAIFSSLVLVHFRDSSSSGKPGCFPDVPSRFLNCPEDSEHTKVVGVGDSILRSAVSQMGPYRSAPLSMSYGTEHTALNLKIETGLNKALTRISASRGRP